MIADTYSNLQLSWVSVADQHPDEQMNHVDEHVEICNICWQ